MKQVININNNRLTFPTLDMSFESDEIKKVTDELFEVLIRNSSIQEVKTEKEINKSKGRKKR